MKGERRAGQWWCLGRALVSPGESQRSRVGAGVPRGVCAARLALDPEPESGDSCEGPCPPSGAREGRGKGPGVGPSPSQGGPGIPTYLLSSSFPPFILHPEKQALLVLQVQLIEAWVPGV